MHQGALGAGIDLDRGVTIHAVHGSNPIKLHPDTGESVIGVTVPLWDTVLLIAARIAEFIPLGYMGVDIVLDAVRGPMVLELNARPGLAIQMANAAGLVTRLNAIDRLDSPAADPQTRIQQARQWFATANRVQLQDEAAA